MPKLLAPHPAVWRGQMLVVAPDGTVDVPDAAVEELAAHGFRAVEDTKPASDGAEAIRAMSRKELLAFIRENGGGNAVTLSNAVLREAALKIIAQPRTED